ncbi:protein kinase-like protein [Aspergillus welwitschiae]|uniref:non-specific serine/threonine protein kinase n=1 Tax=Aspergillus welwitschiae TaxID=1341132 RepID=A0A3F3QB20_9EURO|nr:protein kinase-like protein [Aspergillus welwitschiae]RDH36360.1 protein kinase-like protein [Aspergillus welwitschiae]
MIRHCRRFSLSSPFVAPFKSIILYIINFKTPLVSPEVRPYLFCAAELHNGQGPFGGYSTVWLAHDTVIKRYVALKVNTADALPREATVLRSLSTPRSSTSLPHQGPDLVPILLDQFEVQGPNGTHTCYTTAPAQCNLREISFSRLFPLDVARALCYGLTQAVVYTHSQGYVHGDIHLNNVLIKPPSNFDTLSVKELYEKYGKPETVPITRCDGKRLPPNVPTKAVKPLLLGKYAEKLTLADVRPLLSDFGEAFAPASEIRLGKDCHTPPAFRSPEARFDPQGPLTYSSDIVGMKPIFSTDIVPDDETVAQHMDVLGPMPQEWWQRGEGRSKFFTEDGCPTEAYLENERPPFEESFEIDIQKWRRKWRGAIEEEEKAVFLDVIRRMLAFRPEERPTAKDVLESEWIAKWALPDYERSLNPSC